MAQHQRWRKPYCFKFHPPLIPYSSFTLCRTISFLLASEASPRSCLLTFMPPPSLSRLAHRRYHVSNLTSLAQTIHSSLTLRNSLQLSYAAFTFSLSLVFLLVEVLTCFLLHCHTFLLVSTR